MTAVCPQASITVKIIEAAMMTDQHKGACLCGAVRFETRGALPDVVACHCSQCRKQTGFHYATTDVQMSNFTVVGDDQISWYRASPTARRGFCRTCGSALFWVADDADRIAVMAGLFDAPGALKMGYHIFCADKADFYEISDGLPQLPQGR